MQDAVTALCSHCIVLSGRGGRRKRCAAGPETTRADIRGGGWDEEMYGCRGWDELERYGAGKRGRGAGAWRFSPAGERERPRQHGPGGGTSWPR